MVNITITADAQEHFKKLLSTQSSDTNIRVFVVNQGTPSAECGVSYCPKDSVTDADEMFEYEAFKIYIDKASLPFLEDAEIGFESEDDVPQLTLKAPNARVLKVDENAPLAERVNYVIQTIINPQLASHGGFLSLVDVNEEGIALVTFGGGCNGCSLAAVTLDDGVKAELLTRFPDELTDVQDATAHQRGEHSFYK